MTRAGGRILRDSNLFNFYPKGILKCLILKNMLL